MLPSNKPEPIWTLSTESMKRTWAVTNRTVQQGRSLVAGVVGLSLLEDCSSLVCPETICLPTNQGDDARAEECFFWLAKWAIPIWLSWDQDKYSPDKTEVIGALVQDLEYAPRNINSIGTLIQKLFLKLSTEDVHRRGLHCAQCMGIRAVYRGAIMHSNPQVHMLALLAARVVAGSAPTAEGAASMVIDSTKASVLLLLDELLLEREETCR